MAKILIVDDARSICKMATRALACVGHEVQSTGDALHGLNLFGNGSSWDLTLVDQRMPLLSGEEFIFRACERDPGARIVMITAFATPLLAAQVIGGGALDFLRKPFSTDMLRHTVSTALSHPRRLAPKAVFDPNVLLPQPGEEEYQLPATSWRANGFSFWPLFDPPQGAVPSGFEFGRLFQIREPDGAFSSCFVGLTPGVRAQIQAQTQDQTGHTLAEADSFWDDVCGRALLQFFKQNAQRPPVVLPIYECPSLPRSRSGGLVSWGAFFGELN